MIFETQAIIRPVEQKDRTQLANMIHFGTFVHRHLDWRPPLEWIGHQPFFALESEGRLAAALACPPDPPAIAWVRVFVCSAHFPQNQAWELLWPQTEEKLIGMGVNQLAAIPLQKWYRELLIDHNFIHIHNIISLAWDNSLSEKLPPPKPHNIRDMTAEDLSEVIEIDSNAFGPLWRNSPPLLQLAYNQADFATVAYDENGLTGYQISTPTQYGAHLGRLATHPRAQGRGVAYSLLRNLQDHFPPTATVRLSVNTQDTNFKSIALYQKAGFVETPETFPVFQITF
jgi:ribosomal protein S18 acetylase RimI-like enzyme